jgi:hypothetical protein
VKVIPSRSFVLILGYGKKNENLLDDILHMGEVKLIFIEKRVSIILTAGNITYHGEYSTQYKRRVLSVSLIDISFNW